LIPTSYALGATEDFRHTLLLQHVTPTSGPRDTHVAIVIDGYNFPPGAEVFIGGAPCLSVAVSDDGRSISCTTPNTLGPGTYDVEVIGNGTAILAGAWVST
jgi:hypothetical protein